jgi:hypothetical protein
MSKHTKATTVFLVLAAFAAPTAAARPVEGLMPDSVNASGSDTVAMSSSSGFDWGDAGIGAAGMLALLGVGTGVAAAARRPLTSR